MIAIFVACCIIALLLFKKKKTLDRLGVRQTFRYHFYKHSLEFLLLFLLAMMTYFILLGFVIVVSEYSSLQFLVQLEDFLAKVKSHVSALKLNEMLVLVIFVVIYLLGWVRLPSDKSKILYKLFGKYQTVTKRIYAFLIILCSFTLLGTHYGEPTKDLKVRINLIRTGYADLCSEAQKAVSEEVGGTVLYRR